MSDRSRRRETSSNLKNLTRIGFSTTIHPIGNITDIGNRRGNQKESDTLVPGFHAGYYHFECTSSGFIQYMNL